MKLTDKMLTTYKALTNKERGLACLFVAAVLQCMSAYLLTIAVPFQIEDGSSALVMPTTPQLAIIALRILLLFASGALTIFGVLCLATRPKG